VWVAMSRHLSSVAPKGLGINKPKLDLTKLNPNLAGGASSVQHSQEGTGGMVGSGGGGRGRRDRAIGKRVRIRNGEFKGYTGVIKDTDYTTCRVELHTKNNIISLPRTSLLGVG
jgi:transcription elongation factor SPT5